MWRRAISVWLVLMAAEVIHGAARTIFLEPRIGAAPARRLSVLSGSCLILAIVYLLIPVIRTGGKHQLFRVGCLWVVLTLVFEIGLGRLLGRTWAEVASDFNLPSGGLLPLGLLVLMFSPLIAARLRGQRS